MMRRPQNGPAPSPHSAHTTLLGTWLLRKNSNRYVEPEHPREEAEIDRATPGGANPPTAHRLSILRESRRRSLETEGVGNDWMEGQRWKAWSRCRLVRDYQRSRRNSRVNSPNAREFAGLLSQTTRVDFQTRRHREFTNEWSNDPSDVFAHLFATSIDTTCNTIVECDSRDCQELTGNWRLPLVYLTR